MEVREPGFTSTERHINYRVRVAPSCPRSGGIRVQLQKPRVHTGPLGIFVLVPGGAGVSSRHGAPSELSWLDHEHTAPQAGAPWLSSWCITVPVPQPSPRGRANLPRPSAQMALLCPLLVPGSPVVSRICSGPVLRLDPRLQGTG